MTKITQRFLSVLGLLALAIILGLMLEVLLSIRSATQFGHTQQGHILGWIGLAVMLSVFGYSIKKRQSQAQKTAWPKGWFWLHQGAGVLAPILILVRCRFTFSRLGTHVGAGVDGHCCPDGGDWCCGASQGLELIENRAPRFAKQGLRPEEIEAQLDDLVCSSERFRVWQLIHVPMVIVFLVLLTAHVAGALYFGGL